MNHTLPRPPQRHAAARAALSIGVLFLLVALPPILNSIDRGRPAIDQNDHYYRAIVQFSRQWPRFDFRQYSSATTPGFLVVMAAVHHYISEDIRVIRMAGALVTVGFLATLSAGIAMRLGAGRAVLLVLPMIFSLYVYPSGVWLLPDNAGWWLVLLAILLALRQPVDRSMFILGAFLLAALVFIRQIHIWAAAVLWTAAWFGTSTEPTPEHLPLLDNVPPRLRRMAIMILLTLPAVAVLAWFVHLWGSTTQRQYHDLTQGGNPSIPAIILTTLAIAGPFLLVVAWPRINQLLQRRGTWLFLATTAAVSLVLGVAPLTSYKTPERIGGIWNIVARLPLVADRSPLIWATALLGGLLLGLLLLLPRGRDRWILASAWIAFIPAQSASSTAYQRYYEPFVLIMLALTISRLRPQDLAPNRLPWIAPILLALLNALITAATLWKEGPPTQ